MFNMALRKFSISDSGADGNGSFASEERLWGLETDSWPQEAQGKMMAFLIQK
jgi:hypothetical protein